MSLSLFMTLALCVIIMCVMMSIQMKWYRIKKWKIFPITIALAMTGVVGSQIWYFVENGELGGRSFYGSIVFSPIVFLPLSKVLSIKYAEVLDFVVTCGSLALAAIKLECLNSGCCSGRWFYNSRIDALVCFPSQIVEMIAFIIISMILFFMSNKPNFRGKLFPWFLILYGGSRFFLDFMRETVPSYLFGLSAGSFWSLCSFLIGIAILTIMKCKGKKEEKADS